MTGWGVKAKGDTFVEMKARDSSDNGRIDVLGWGDFNGDGVEDVLCSVYYHSSGSLMTLHFMMLSKASKDGRIVDITEQVPLLREQ
jgi:hypothetical protein